VNPQVSIECLISIGITGRGLATAVFQHLQNRDERIQDEGLGEVEEALTKTGIEDSPKEGGVRKRKGIRARVARRWLRRLGFNWRQCWFESDSDSKPNSDSIEFSSRPIQ
jgi:hypothetical protein